MPVASIYRRARTRTDGYARIRAVVLPIASTTLALGSWCPAGECPGDRLVPSIHGMDDSFSRCLALRNDLAVVGAPKYDGIAWDSGAAFVFRRGDAGWTEEALLLPSDGLEFGQFGTDVDVGDGVVLVGAHQYDAGGTGAAYVHRFDGSAWSQEARLAADDGELADFFGGSVAMSGTWALVGAARNVGEYFNGAAYFFRYTGVSWVEMQKVSPFDGLIDDRFGFDVALSGNLAVIGSPYDDNNGNASGSAYVYRNDGGGWILDAHLLASDGAPDDLFGEVVAIDGDVVVVSSRLHEVYSLDNGAVYVFRRTGGSWTEEAKLVPPADVVQENFGFDVAIDGDVIVVGNVTACNPAGAYVFRHDGTDWFRDGKISQHVCSFGMSVAVSDGSAFVGAPGEANDGAISGAAYAYDLEWCDGDIDCDGEVGFHDLVNLLFVWGDCTVPYGDCSGDFDGDGTIGFADLLILLDGWGPC